MISMSKWERWLHRESEDSSLGLCGLLAKSLIQDGTKRFWLVLIRPASISRPTLPVGVSEVWMNAAEKPIYAGGILRRHMHSNAQ